MSEEVSTAPPAPAPAAPANEEITPPAAAAAASEPAPAPPPAEAAAAASDARIPSSAGARTEFWRAVQLFYKEGLFCDLALVCQGQQTLYCHKMVLAVLSKVGYSMKISMGGGSEKAGRLSGFKHFLVIPKTLRSPPNSL